MPIRLLPPEVSAKIAAGEVIERPASVVKELVENSIDAGAAAVAVAVRSGGLASIRVTDDGCGIPADEALLAFERHATSKLGSIDDLSRIGTLGFRGEALASIAAAATVRLTTCVVGAGGGTQVELEGGVLVRRGGASAPAGTTIEVEALFATFPARLKFIRSPAAEAGRIRRTVDHLAMAHPRVRFALEADGRLLIATSGNGSLRDVVAAVHGAGVAGGMIDVDAGPGPYPVRGLTSTPAHSRANRTGLSVFVNGRWVQNRTIGVAIEEAYRGLLMEGRFPVAVVFVEVPPAEVDVNVHPNKREVRLQRDGDAFSSVQRAVREALLGALPIVEAHGLLDGASPAVAPAVAPRFEMTPPPWTDVWAPLPEPAPTAPDSASDAPAPSSLSGLRMLGQIANTYIVADGPDGMYLIDQHAAHESLLYYRLLRQWEESAPDVQPMLEPLPVELSPPQLEALADARAALERYGLVIEPFGDDVWLVRAIPVIARRVDVPKLLAEVLDGLRPGTTGTPTHLAAAASIACHSAVRAGQTLSAQELVALGDALVAEGNPQHCPHGRPAVVRIATSLIEKQFGRA